MQSVSVFHRAVRRLGMPLMCLHVGFLSACTGSPAKPDQSDIPDEIVRTAKTYISDNKNWPEADYHLRLVGRHWQYIIILVIHHDDLTAWTEGGGLSITLTIDANTLVVRRELGFQ